jgi:hypothetical protein
MMEAIDQFLDIFGDSQVALDKLDEGDWEMLDKINAMLSVLMEATKSLEGSAVSLTEGLPAMDFILSKFEGTKQYKDDRIMAPLYQNS